MGFAALLISALLLSRLWGTRPVLSKPSFVKRIPNGASFPAVPALGHVHADGSHGSLLNEFGRDFRVVGKLHWTEALCRLDSDGDGATNGEELGDPDCTWLAGSEVPPAFSSPLSHPGDAGDVVPRRGPSGSPSIGKEYPPATVTSAPVQESTNDVDDEGVPTWLVAHVTLMVLGPGLVLPVSIAMRLFSKDFREAHKWLALIGSGIMILGLVPLVAWREDGVRVSTIHGATGLLVLLAALGQATLGQCLHSGLEQQQSSRRVHASGGYALCVLVVAVFVTGFGNLEVWVKDAVWLGLIHGGAVVVGAGAVVVLRRWRDSGRISVWSAGAECDREANMAEGLHDHSRNRATAITELRHSSAFVELEGEGGGGEGAGLVAR